MRPLISQALALSHVAPHLQVTTRACHQEGVQVRVCMIEEGGQQLGHNNNNKQYLSRETDQIGQHHPTQALTEGVVVSSPLTTITTIVQVQTEVEVEVKAGA